MYKRQVVSVCVDKANAILELDTMDIDGKEIQPENYDIRLSNVSFSYDKRKIIDDISLSIPQKTTTAIVGPSGGGKSTLPEKEQTFDKIFLRLFVP